MGRRANGCPPSPCWKVTCMDARWKIEHVKLDVPPDYLLFKNQKLGWASVSLVRFSSHSFFSLISLFQRVLGMPQERLLPNAVVQLNCIVLHIDFCFQTLQCQSVEWYSTTGTTQLFQPAARPHGQELQNSFLAIWLQEWLVTGWYWLLLIQLANCLVFCFKCDELCLQIFVHVEVVWQGVSRPRCWEPGWASTFDCDKFSSIYLLQEH